MILRKKKYENFLDSFDFKGKKKYDFNGFDEDGIHKDTGKYYDLMICSGQCISAAHFYDAAT